MSDHWEATMDQQEILSSRRDLAAEATRETLRQVFHASYQRLVVQLYAVTGDALEAEDLVQEAFVRAVSAGRRMGSVDNPEAWLRTVAINLHRRRWRRMRTFARITPRIPGPTDLPGLDEHVVVIKALRQLPEGQRQALALHYLADMQLADIAETLGIAEGTVKSRLNRGRAAMAALLADGDGDD
jgi:RNA polymerase sigma-70 factor, ECF subfamily